MPRATLSDGTAIAYKPQAIGSGGEKTVYLTEDGASVVALYHDANASHDQERLRRLEAIIGRFNPTVGTSTNRLWSTLFCWPTAVVRSPSLGLVAPRYPDHYFFSDGPGPWARREKQGKWFSSSKVRQYLPPSERGNWLGYLQVCIQMARAVGRLHSAGLAHSDLSSKNVLVDPVKGSCIIIDIDSLVVPGIHPPRVMGTRDYMAPEVVAGHKLPSVRTDQHALAVLIYEYLLLRHPLRGPKRHSLTSEEQDERLAMGERALFIEHPNDASNHPHKPLAVPLGSVGPFLERAFLAAFVDGLHAPDRRPTAIDWERALVHTTDVLLPCSNTRCEAKWMAWPGTSRPTCPFCGAPYRGSVPIMNLYLQRRPGQFASEQRRVALWPGWSLQKWHVYDNVWPSIGADKQRLGYVMLDRGTWRLVNSGSGAFRCVDDDRIIGPGESVELREGLRLMLAPTSAHGRLVVFQIA